MTDVRKLGLKLRDALSRRMTKVGSLFQLADLDGDGQVSRDEFRHVCLLALGMFDVPQQVTDDLFDELDVDASGEVDYSECVRYMLRDGLRRSAQRVRDLFHVLDADGNGTLDKLEFRHVLGLLGWELDDPYLIDEVFDAMDVDHSGTLTYAEMHRQLRIGVGMGKYLDGSLQAGAAGEIVTKARNKQPLRGSLDAQLEARHRPKHERSPKDRAITFARMPDDSQPRSLPGQTLTTTTLPQAGASPRTPPRVPPRVLANESRLPALSPRKSLLDSYAQTTRRAALTSRLSPEEAALQAYLASALDGPQPPEQSHISKSHGRQHGRSPRLDILQARAKPGGFQVPVVRRVSLQEEFAGDGGLFSPGEPTRSEPVRSRVDGFPRWTFAEYSEFALQQAALQAGPAGYSPVRQSAGARKLRAGSGVAVGHDRIMPDEWAHEEMLDRVKAERYSKQQRVDYQSWQRLHI